MVMVTFVGSVMGRRQAPFDDLKVCNYLQVFELLEQSKGVLKLDSFEELGSFCERWGPNLHAAMSIVISVSAVLLCRLVLGLAMF